MKKLNVNEYIGKKFNHLTIIKDLGMNENHRTIVHCLCDCGNTKDIWLTKVKLGIVKSCGCLVKTQGGLPYNKRERLHGVWTTMKSRCYNPNFIEYPRYGGLGIHVCDEWKNSYKNFKEWAESHGYDKDAKRGECTLDRIDVNGDYEPSNCRWVSMKIQSNNKRNNHYIEYNGEIHTLQEWSDITGINQITILDRIRNGDTDELLFRPPDKNNRIHAQLISNL